MLKKDNKLRPVFIQPQKYCKVSLSYLHVRELSDLYCACNKKKLAFIRLLSLTHYLAFLGLNK